jgi:transcriptional regulator with XRE-family HTH domain
MNQRIRQFIKSNGMTFSFVAQRSGVGIKKFSRFMCDKQQMTTEEYEKICIDGLNVDPTYFFNKEVLETQNNTA